jgi:hypothetical protein
MYCDRKYCEKCQGGNEPEPRIPGYKEEPRDSFSIGAEYEADPMKEGGYIKDK